MSRIPSRVSYTIGYYLLSGNPLDPLTNVRHKVHRDISLIEKDSNSLLTKKEIQKMIKDDCAVVEKLIWNAVSYDLDCMKKDSDLK